MATIDTRTPRLNLPVPVVTNALKDDCPRLVEAFTTLDGAVAGNIDNLREQWRRQLADAGLTLVDGSFEEGATVDDAADAVWHASVGKCYKWDGDLPKTVPADSTPSSTGGVAAGAWNSVNDVTVRKWAESTLSPLPYAKISGKSFTTGGTAEAGKSALLNLSDGYYYTPKSGSITVPADSSPDADWICVGLLNGHEINDLRNWGDVLSNQDIMPLLRKAYLLVESSLVIPPGEHRVILTDTLDPVRNETYPMGIRMTRESVSLIFSPGASLKMDTVTSNRYVVIDAYYAHHSNIINPKIIGDVETHEGSTGEWGYGIRNYNSGNFCVTNPDISYCWGDGILWFVNDTAVYGGAILGKGVYRKCRRQGISVISCRGLFIEDSTGIEISGATNGPWATIDVEPDLSTEFIISLEIGKVKGVNNQGPAFLIAIHQMLPTSVPVDITVEDVNAIGCQRAMEARGDGGVYGVIKIGNVTGRNSKNQEFQTVKWLENCTLEVDNFTSINPNQAGDTSSPYGVAIGIYNNYAGGTAGGIKFNKIRIINPQSNLTHPIAITNTIAGAVGTYEFGEIVYDRSRFVYPEIHNPAAAIIRTNTVIYREYTSSGHLENTRWCNGVRNTDAATAITLTVPTGYGFDGMELTAWCNHPTSQMNLIFSDLFEGRSTEVRSSAIGKLVAKKLMSTWFLAESPANTWSQNGTGRYSYGLNEGGVTANRPSNPKHWQKYFDTTLGYEMTWRPDTQQWVKSSGS